MDEAQLRGGRLPNEDTGELAYGTLADMMAKFLAGGFWKLSFTTPDGRRIRIVKQYDGSLDPTTWSDEKKTWVTIPAL